MNDKGGVGKSFLRKESIMKIAVTILSAAFVFLGFNQQAKAGILLEPYLGYVSGSQKQSSKNNFTGTEAGARVGYSFFGFALGADYITASYTDDASPKDTITEGELGAFVSFKFPILFRVYASYVPSSELKVKNSSVSSTLKDGSATRVGVGFTGLPIVNINFEIVSADYGKATALGTTSTLSPKSTTTGYALSVSAPFDLF
jgi:hypothetical protein